jgi:sugar lactone lactonase YvrE
MIRVTTVLTAGLFLLVIACSDSDNDNANVTPAPLLQSYELSSKTSVPEGVTFDPQQRRFYATSLQGGSIVGLEPSGAETTFSAADDRAELLGAKVDEQARRLWVCAREVDGLDNRVWVFSLETGELELEFLLGAITTNGSCNDLILDSQGVAYVTDPANPYLYRLDPVSGTGSIFATSPLFNDITGIDLGLNGIAITPDESALIVGKFTPATLFRVSLPDGDSIETLSLSGDNLPSPDGLAILDGNLYAVSGSSVSRVKPNADFSSAEVVTVEQKSGLSTATVAESQLYVIKSEVTNFFLTKPLDTPFEIFRIDLDAFNR